jgi:hypothetical protein
MTGAEAPQNEAPASTSGRARNGGRARWTIAIAIALAVHAGAFLAWRVPETRMQPTPASPPRVSFSTVSPESSLSDQLDLFDPAPLFLPTEWNYATAVKALKSDRSPGEMFDLYAPEWTAKPDQSPEELVMLPTGVEDAVSALRRFEWQYFTAFGRLDRPLVRLPQRLALMEVRSIATGRNILTREIPVSASSSAQGWGLWTPLEFLVSVQPSGMLGPPDLAHGSGFEEIDAFFRGYIQHETQLDLRVPAGYYRVTIGP